VRLEFESAETPVNASVDRIAIEQALNNLVVNAIESATRSDETRGLVRITLAREPATMRIEVEDDGPGVSEEIASHLFEAFETTKPRGMGLGLTLAQQIVAKHGGRLSWRARAPRGAVFVIELPAKDAALET
jgi:two-component system sensor kinase FixL